MRRFLLATIAALIVLVGTLPTVASAKVDVGALIPDSPVPGWAPATEGTGPVTEDGEVAPPGYAPNPLSGYIGGYTKAWTSDAGVVGILILEYTSAAIATSNLNNETAGRGMQVPATAARGTVTEIPGSTSVTWDDPSGAVPVRSLVTGFRHDRLVAIVYGVFRLERTDAALVNTMAVSQYARLLDALPVEAADSGASGDDSSSGTRTSVIVAVGIVVLIAILFAVVALLRRGNARASTWSPPTHTHDLAPGAATGAALADPAWINAPAPSGPAAHGHVPPPPGARPTVHAPAPQLETFAPVIPVLTTIDPRVSAAATAPVRAHAPAPAPAATVTIAPVPCATCGNDFGRKEACDSCGALRTACVVCGTRIWAGAMTCSAHSGLVR